MREMIAAIVDPPAFALMPTGVSATSMDELLADRRDRALAKADEILALQFSFEDLPADLQQTVERLGAAFGEGPNPFDALQPMICQDGRPAFTGLVKPLEDGTLLVAALLETQDEGADDDKSVWQIGTLRSDEARRFVAELEVAAAGGGSA